jgi:hypothetical protein
MHPCECIPSLDSLSIFKSFCRSMMFGIECKVSKACAILLCHLVKIMESFYQGPFVLSSELYFRPVSQVQVCDRAVELCCGHLFFAPFTIHFMPECLIYLSPSLGPSLTAVSFHAKIRCPCL